MVKSKNMAKSGRKVTRRERPVLKLWGSARSNRAVQTFYALPKIHKHAQLIFHDGITRCHTTVFDTGAHQLMIGQGVWEIGKFRDTWIDT